MLLLLRILNPRLRQYQPFPPTFVHFIFVPKFNTFLDPPFRPAIIYFFVHQKKKRFPPRLAFLLISFQLDLFNRLVPRFLRGRQQERRRHTLPSYHSRLPFIAFPRFILISDKGSNFCRLSTMLPSIRSSGSTFKNIIFASFCSFSHAARP